MQKIKVYNNISVGISNILRDRDQDQKYRLNVIWKRFILMEIHLKMNNFQLSLYTE